MPGLTVRGNVLIHLLFPPWRMLVLRHALIGVILVFLAHRASGATRVEAYPGVPYGVARVSVDVRERNPVAPLGDDRFAIEEATGRVLYPVIEAAPVRRVLRQLLEIESPRQVTCYFLFQGSEPFNVTIYAPQAVQVRIVPEQRPPRFHRRTLDRWWKETVEHYKRLERSGEYPRMVHNYLLSMLSRRLGLPIPQRGLGLTKRTEINQALGMLFGTESIRAATQQDLLLERNVYRLGEVADQPLPPPVTSASVILPEVLDEVAIEPIAMPVPQECFYVRFGNFRNYLWLRKLTAEWGGDLANMVAIRSIDQGVNHRIEQQLALKESALASVLGPTVINDVAIIGLDTMIADGGAVGILFHARNNFALRTDFNRQRREARGAHPEAQEETIEIEGTKVSYLSTPLGEIRSYYVQAGDFHLVTTSRRIVERFLEASRGEGSLGASAEFRYARSLFPIDRNDTAFAFLSDAFVRNLISPHYRIEMRRRLRSEVEIELAEIAPLAAAAEGLAGLNDEQMMERGYLPQGYGEHPDGSRLEVREGVLVDSLRGRPGYFVPIPDMPVESATPAEVADYERFRVKYESDWQQVDPIIAAISREDVSAGVERMTIDVEVTPYHEPTYGPLVRQLGEPTRQALVPPADDVATIQGWVKIGGLLGGGGLGKRTVHLFAGLRDFEFPLVVNGGNIDFGAPRQLIRGYVGSMPPVSLLDIFFPTSDAPPDADGIVSPARGGEAWKQQIGEMSVFSFKRDVLARVVPQLHYVEAERPAQIRLKINDLSGRPITGLVNALAYKRARDVSISATRFINSLHQQLHVPREESREVAERLVDGNFVCPMGGKYQMVDVPGSLPVWVSTAVEPSNRWLMMSVPTDYEFPLLSWFRGLSAELGLAEQSLFAQIQVDVARQTVEVASSTPEDAPEEIREPRLPIFSLPFGGRDESDEADSPAADQELPPIPPTEAEELPPPRDDQAPGTNG